MGYLVIGLLCVILVSEGVGQGLFHLLGYKPKYTCYAAPYGVAAIFCLLEIVYLPVLLTHGSFKVVQVISMIVVSLCMVPFLMSFKDTMKTIFRARTLYLLGATLLMSGIFYYYGLPHMLDDLSLQNMASLVYSSTLKMEQMPLQGYTLFGTLIFWVGNLHPVKVVLFLSLFTTIIGMMMSLNFVDSFQLPNPWFRFTLIFFSLFYVPFYSFKIMDAFHATNWRLLWIGLLLYTAYTWLKDHDEKVKILIPIVIGAGLFVHHSFFMIGIEVCYCIMVYLFKIQKIRAIYDIFTFLSPIIIYSACLIGMKVPALGWLLGIVVLLFYLFRNKKKFYLLGIQAEDFCIAHNKKVFMIGIPVIFLVGTFIMRWFVHGYGTEYSSYIQYFSRHSVAGFLFPKGNIIDMIMDIFRWGGVIIFAIKAYRDEDCLLKYICICMLLFFINPLCTGMLVEMTGVEAYASAFEILFNPFTDIVVFIAIYHMFEWTVIGQWVLELCLVFAVLFGHITSYSGLSMGLYSGIVNYSEEVSQ